MYCRKCGCKIKSGEKTCSDCGNEVDLIEYCGGFWGLVGQNVKVTEVVAEKLEDNEIIKNSNSLELAELEKKEYGPVVNKQESKTDLTDELDNTKRKNKKRTYMKMLCCALIISLLICLVQTVGITIFAKNYIDLQRKNKELETKYEQLENKYGKICSENTKLISQQVELEESITENKNDTVGDEQTDDIKEDFSDEMEIDVSNQNEQNSENSIDANNVGMEGTFSNIFEENNQ